MIVRRYNSEYYNAYGEFVDVQPGDTLVPLSDPNEFEWTPAPVELAEVISFEL